ncbi:MAG TPA: non-homologous end-joining DNA ligase, partial [Chitinophaga sp.]
MAVTTQTKARSKKAARSARQANISAGILRKTPKSSFPDTFTPMLATLADKPFDHAGWLYEIKWDGYRALAFMNRKSTELRSRNNKSFNEQFYPVYEAVKAWGLHAVIDGEIAVINAAGQSDFSLLQQWRSEADGRLIYYVFDILWLNGHDLSQLPLSTRRAVLEEQIRTVPGDIIRLSESFDATGTEFFNIAKQMGLEGIIAKRAESLYYPGERSRDWLKIKTSNRQEVVIGGYTKNEGSGKPFSSLLVGVFENGKLQYTGKIGTGFNAQQQKQLLQQFKALEVKKSPFAVVPDINKPSRFRPNPPQAVAVWLKPRLVCGVSFREMTSDGVMRHPSFEGMREDKGANEVTREEKVSVQLAVGSGQSKKGIARLAIGKRIPTPAGRSSRKTLLNPSEETQVREVGGHPLKFTNLSKVFWPKEKISKRDMLNYYYQV